MKIDIFIGQMPVIYHKIQHEGVLGKIFLEDDRKFFQAADQEMSAVKPHPLCLIFPQKILQLFLADRRKKDRSEQVHLL